MASSVARMPSAEEWRDPGRLAAAVFGASHGRTSFNPAHLRKVLVCQQQHGDAPSSSPRSSSSSCSSSSPASNAVGNSVEEDGSSPAAAPKRQSQILDRWAARQARGMVTTIERQAHEAEISALTTTSQPVLSRAKSLLREASPALPESSVGSAAPSPYGAGDVPRNVRASSLIQMWRELEAEAGLTPRNRSESSGGHAENFNAASFSPDEPSGGNSDGFEDPDAFGEWDSDMTAVASSEPAISSPSSLNEDEKGRVGSIVRMLSSGDRTHSFMESLHYENKPSARESPSSNRPSGRQNPSSKKPLGRDTSSSNKPSGQENPMTTDKAESFSCTVSSGLSRRRLRGRQEMEDLVARMEQERRRELVALAEHRCVSRFAYRGRLQSMVKLRSMRQQVTEKDQLRAPSRTLELGQLHNGASISFLRERFNQRGHHSGSRKPTQESLSSIHVQFPMDAEGSGYTNSSDQFTGDNIQDQDNQYQVTVSPGDSENTPPETNSPHSGSDDLQAGSHFADGSWDETNLWMNSLDWQRPAADSLPSNAWQGEIVAEELESFPQHNVSSWISEPSSSWRQWRVSTPPVWDDWFQNFSDNAEIRELLDRRRVSTTLASDFCDKMNQMILSFLQRQGKQSFDENFADNHVDHPFWGQSEEYQNTEQVASVPSSLVPLQYHTLNYPVSWQHASFSHQSSHHVLDMEAMHDFRSAMAQIHQEISELRKMVESCMESQANLQQSIKQDILDAIHQSTGTGSTLNSSVTSGRKGNCYICCKMQVDSLFYRCGHMCTCFNCACELQWSSGKCPICRSPIEDVVRACRDS